MKTVWVICETVDLGYHMVKGYDSYDKAKAEFFVAVSAFLILELLGYLVLFAK